MLKLEKFADRLHLQVVPLQANHIPAIVALWNRQYARLIEIGGCRSRSWLDNTEPLENVIEQHIATEGSLVVLLDGHVVGFMTYDVFDFHTEPTAFFPIMAHTAEEAYQITLYRLMYAQVAQYLVARGCLNHLFTFFAHNQPLQACLYELGFGLYVVDAYRGVEAIHNERPPTGLTIRPADLADVEPLWVLVQASDAYYAESPLFLKRDSEGQAELEKLLTDTNGVILVAFKDEAIVGFLNIRRNQTADVITLSDQTTGCIDPLGAYIQPAYRGQGIGQALLTHAINWARQQALTQIHVDFESANIYANQFWPRYFTPTLYSVKRRLNNDLATVRRS